MNTVSAEAIQKAQEQLETHLREIVAWHFTPETGCPFWLDWASGEPRTGTQPRKPAC